MNNELVVTVIHDLKNTLGVLNGGLSTMVERATGTAMEAEVRHSHAIAAQLSQNLISFLTLYRADHGGGLSVRPLDHNPEDFLRDLAAALVLPADAPQVKVEMTERLAPYWFYDAYFVQMAIGAAVQNAVRFARSTVTLSARMCDGFLVYCVQDDGPGLGAEGAPSTGLGTVLCGAIAEAHRNGKRAGRVSLHSRPEGGAVFELWLP
jgi:signal transduction histidine kinase